MNRCCVLLLLIVLPCLVSAEVYQWVDAQGNKHFSDTPPPDKARAKEISESLKPANIDESRAERQKLKQLFAEPTAEEKQYQRQKQPADQEKQQKKQEYCNYLRNRLSKISRRVIFVDADGNDVKVSEAERKQRVKNLETMIKQRC